MIFLCLESENVSLRCETHIEILSLAYIHIHTCRTGNVAKESRRRRGDAFGGLIEPHGERAGCDDGQQVGLEELCRVSGVARGTVAEIDSGVITLIEPLCMYICRVV